MSITLSPAWKTLARYLGILLVVVIGVFLGFFIAVKSGLTERLGGSGNGPEQFVNSTTIKTGEQFPAEIVAASPESQAEIDGLLRGHKTIVAFVSSGCNTCDMFLNFLATTEGVKSGRYHVLLFSADPAHFHESSGFQCLHLPGQAEVNLAIRVFPTIVGVDEDGNVSFVSAGFRREMDEDYFDKNL